MLSVDERLDVRSTGRRFEELCVVLEERVQRSAAVLSGGSGICCDFYTLYLLRTARARPDNDWTSSHQDMCMAGHLCVSGALHLVSGCEDR